MTEEREHSVLSTSYRLSAVSREEEPRIDFGGFSFRMYMVHKLIKKLFYFTKSS